MPWVYGGPVIQTTEMTDFHLGVDYIENFCLVIFSKGGFARGEV